MKTLCAIMDCEEEAAERWQCCNPYHGLLLKKILATLKMSYSAKNRQWYGWEDWKDFIAEEPPNIEQAFYYSQFL